MDSLYSRFLGVGLQNKVRENNRLSRSSSMPFYLSFQARQLPDSLNGGIPFKKRNGGITSSDIKVQMLEEKIRNLEDQHNQMVKSFNENNKINSQLPSTQSNIMPIPLLILNNNDNNNNNLMSRTQVINNELQTSKLKFEKYRGLQKQDYTPNMGIYSNGDNLEYNSIFNRKKDYNKIKSKEEKYRLKNYLLNGEIKNNKLRNKAKKFVNKLDEEIYSPIEKDFHNYMNNVNMNIQQQLKEDNIILNEDIDKIENDFNDIKILLNEKLQNMENKQKENFEKLKNVIRKVGGRKMSKSIQNVFEGKNYDLQKAEEEYLANDIFNLPNIINKKMTEEELMNIEKEKRLRIKIEKEMNEEFLRKRKIEELKHKEKLKTLEIEREKERIENLKTLNMLRYQIRKENEDNYNNYINNMNNPNYMNNVNNMNQFNMAKNFSLNDISKIFFMKQMKKMNNINENIPFNMAIFNNMGTDEILKYMLLRNMGLNNNLENMNNFYPENEFFNNMINNNFDNYNNFNYNINGENFNNNINNDINENNINNINENNKSIIKENLNKNENIKSKFSTSITRKEKNSKISKKIKSKSIKNESKKSKNNNLKQNEGNKERKITNRESKSETSNSEKSKENKKTNKEKKGEENNKKIESSKASSKSEEEQSKKIESSKTSSKKEEEKKEDENEDENNIEENEEEDDDDEGDES